MYNQTHDQIWSTIARTTSCLRTRGASTVIFLQAAGIAIPEIAILNPESYRAHPTYSNPKSAQPVGSSRFWCRR